MSEQTAIIIVTTMIGALAPTLAALAAWLQSKATHKEVNSKLSAWLDTEHRQGMRDGREAERNAPELTSATERSLVSELFSVLKKYEHNDNKEKL